ncbi:MAG: hypothetical protein FWE68_06865 [Defluviitaleaceae bacterium]|nr:hypothetical protein [Defluviitaleaceae bacterium]
MCYLAPYYDPSIGRFTQQDGWGYANPNDPLSLNLYVYCNNNPVMYWDPSGHFLQFVAPALIKGLFALGAAIITYVAFQSMVADESISFQFPSLPEFPTISSPTTGSKTSSSSSNSFPRLALNPDLTITGSRTTTISIPDSLTRTNDNQQYVTLYHYGYMSSAASYAAGMQPYTWYTITPSYSGSQATSLLSLDLTNKSGNPDGVVAVQIPIAEYQRLLAGGYINPPEIVPKEFGQDGGGIQIYSKVGFKNGANGVKISPIVPVRP